MDNLDALKALLAKVKAGKEPTSTDVFDSFQIAGGIGVYALQVLSAYNGSLDAAMALHEAVLPDWYVDEAGNNSKSMGWTFLLVSIAGTYISSHSPNQGVQTDPARAWLIAQIKALISEVGV